MDLNTSASSRQLKPSNKAVAALAEARVKDNMEKRMETKQGGVVKDINWVDQEADNESSSICN